MGLDLFNTTVLSTYDSLIKVGDNDTLTGIPKLLSDGRGNDTPIWLSTNSLGIGVTPESGYTFQVSGLTKLSTVTITSNVTANSFIKSGGLSAQFLKADGSVDSNTYQSVHQKGLANGYAPLDSGAKISEAYLPDSIVGQLEYQGTWNATTNTPTLPSASTVKGHYYVTSVAGTYETIEYAIGDWIISNGTSWEKVDNTDAVTTVFGRIGAIVANSNDYSDFYHPLDGDLDANASTATTLQTARFINGTSFDGSANITTSIWGTARNITIGDTAKSVSGGSNVAWSRTELGITKTNIDALNIDADTLDGIDSTGFLRLYPRLTGNASAILTSGIHRWDVSTASDDPLGALDGLLTTKYWDSTPWAVQSYHDFHSNKLYLKSKQNNTWQSSWSEVWTSTNDGLGSGLDADLLDGLQGWQFLRSDTSDTMSGTLNITGSLAIGKTTSPATTLDINGGILANGNIATSAGNISANYNISAGGNISAVGTVTGSNLSGTNTGDQDLSGYLLNTTDTLTGTLSVTGNLGIGTSGSSYKLAVLGSGYILDLQSSSNAYLSKYTNSVGTLGYIGSGNGIASGGSSSDFGVGAQSNLVFTAGGTTERMRIDSAGRVGIGTDSPSSKLYVKNVGSGENSSVFANNSWAAQIYNTQDSATAGGLVVGSRYANNDNIIFQAGNVFNNWKPFFTIKGGGNVGIGTNTPQSLLHIYKSSSGGVGGELRLDNNNSAIGNKTRILFSDGAGGSTSADRAAIVCETEASPYMGQLQFQTGIGSISTKMLITGTGKVGIGTDSPTAKLHLYVNSANDDTFHIYNGSVRTHLLGSESRNGVIYMRSSANSNTIRINASGDSYFNGGNVGIGVSNPSAKLDVNGTIKGNYLGLGTAPNTTGPYALNMGDSIDMNAQNVDYVSQLHFADNVRFYDDGNDNFLNFKYGDAAGGGIRFRNGVDAIKGYIFGDGEGFGLLDNDGQWAVKTQTGTLPLELRCNNNVEFEVYDTYTNSPGSSRAPIFYDSNNTGYYVDAAYISNLNSLNVATINRNPVVQLSGDVTGSATMTNLGDININAQVVNDSHTHDNRYYTEEESERITARALGWVPAYSNNDESTVFWNETEQAVQLQSSFDASIGISHKAIRMKAGDKVRVTVMIRSALAASAGLYVRLYFYSGNLPNGKTHVSANASSSSPYVQQYSTDDTNWYENGAIGVDWTNFQRAYTAPADGYMSLVILNWTSIGTGIIYIKQPDIQFEKVNQATISDLASDAQLLDGIDSNRIVYGNGPSKVLSHTNANSYANSGFYENDGGGSNWPSSTWYNSINVRHSNQGNYHGFQAAMSYYDNLFWFRSYKGSGTFQAWEHALSSGAVAQTKSGILQSDSSFRAPFFYDTNNTGYYLDANGTSNLNQARFLAGISVNSITSSTAGYGVSLHGTQTDSFPTYGLAFTGTATQGTHGSVTGSWATYFTMSGATDRGWIFKHETNRVASISSTGSASFNSDVRTPILYDSNNTGYYVDAASTSELYDLKIRGNYARAYAHSGSDFPNGTLVQTDIPSSTTNGASFVLEATGKSYSTNPPFGFTAQGYLYNNSIINYSGVHTGYAGFSQMKVFNNNGNLAFWWPRVSYWNSFAVHVRDAGGNDRNRVTSITDSTEPTGTKKVTITMKVSALYNQNSNAGDLYATRYYDSNSTGYYLEPAGQSRLGNIERLTHSTGFLVGSYNTAGGNSTNTNPIYTIGNNYKPTDTALLDMYGIGYTHTNASFVSLTGASQWGMYVAADGDARVWLDGSTGNISSTGSLFSANYYDYNNTGYYLDPASTSDSALKIRGGALFGPNATWGKYLMVGGDGRQNYTNNTSTASVVSTNGNLHLDAASGFETYINFYDGVGVHFGSGGSSTVGKILSDGSARFPIFYDYNDTAYYVDPASASRLNQVRANYSDILANPAYALRFWDGNDGYSIRMSESSNGAYGGRVGGETTSDYNMYFTMGGGTNRGFVFNNGLGNPIAGIDASGNGRFEGDVVAFSASDKRLKDNIKPIENALEKVNKISGVEFDWNSNQDTYADGMHDIGVIAQEIEEVMPEVVKTRDNGYKAVKYEKIVPLLIEAIKEQQKQIDELKQLINK